MWAKIEDVYDDNRKNSLPLAHVIFMSKACENLDVLKRSAKNRSRSSGQYLKRFLNQIEFHARLPRIRSIFY